MWSGLKYVFIVLTDLYAISNILPGRKVLVLFEFILSGILTASKQFEIPLNR